MSVMLGMGIAYKDGMYEITVQTADPFQMSLNRNAERSPTVVYTEQEKTIYEAIRKITTKTSRKIYSAHLRLLILDEHMARSGIEDVLDLMFRDYEPRPDFYIALAKGSSPREILKLMTPAEPLSALELHKSLILSEQKWAPTAAVNVLELYRMLTKEGIEPVLTGLTLKGDRVKGATMENVQQPEAVGEYQFEGIGVFRDDRFLGWLNKSDSKAYSYVRNKIANTVGKVRCPGSDDFFVTEVTSSKSKIKPLVRNGEPAVRIELTVEANIGESYCNMDLKKESNFLQLQQAGSEKLRTIVAVGIAHVQKRYGSDIFGFGNEFHKKHPAEWKRWKEDWDRRFSALPIEIEMNYKLRKLGKSINNFKTIGD